MANITTIKVGSTNYNIYPGTTVAIAKGGTGATTAAAARTNLGITTAVSAYGTNTTGWQYWKFDNSSFIACLQKEYTAAEYTTNQTGYSEPNGVLVYVSISFPFTTTKLYSVIGKMHFDSHNCSMQASTSLDAGASKKIKICGTRANATTAPSMCVSAFVTGTY